MGIRAAFPTKEGLRDPAAGVHFLDVVDGEGEEIPVPRLVARDGRGKGDGFPEADEGGPVGLLGDLAGLDAQVAPGEIDFEGFLHCLFPFSLTRLILAFRRRKINRDGPIPPSWKG